MDRHYSEDSLESPEDNGASRLEQRNDLGTFAPLGVKRVLDDLKVEDDLLEEMLDRES